MCYTGLHYLLLKFCQKFSTYYWVIKYLQLHLIFSYFSIATILYCMYIKLNMSLHLCYVAGDKLNVFLNDNLLVICKKQRKISRFEFNIPHEIEIK